VVIGTLNVSSGSITNTWAGWGYKLQILGQGPRSGPKAHTETGLRRVSHKILHPKAIWHWPEKFLTWKI